MRKDADPWAPVPSVAVTVTWKVPLVAGSVPETRPVAGLIDRPLGRPAAEEGSGCPAAESSAWTDNANGRPTPTSRLPGSVTVMMALAGGANAAMPLGVPQPVGPSYPVIAWHR